MDWHCRLPCFAQQYILGNSSHVESPLARKSQNLVGLDEIVGLMLGLNDGAAEIDGCIEGWLDGLDDGCKVGIALEEGFILG